MSAYTTGSSQINPSYSPTFLGLPFQLSSGNGCLLYFFPFRAPHHPYEAPFSVVQRLMQLLPQHVPHVHDRKGRVPDPRAPMKVYPPRKVPRYERHEMRILPIEHIRRAMCSLTAHEAAMHSFGRLQAEIESIVSSFCIEGRVKSPESRETMIVLMWNDIVILV
jgi:hypothetical protein